MTLSTRAVLGATAATALVLAAASTAALAQADNLTPQEKSLIEAAKEEGSVTIIHPIFSDHTTRDLGQGFVERYGLGPDFKVYFLRKGTGATVAQVRQEILADKYTVDVHIVSAPGFFSEAAERDALLPIDSGYWEKDFTEAIEKAGQYSNYPYVVTPFAYTFQPVWNTSCPGMEDVQIDSYVDAVDPSLAGKTISSDVTKSFTYTNTVIALMRSGAVDIEDMWAKLKAQDPIVEFRGEPKMQMVISCQRPFDMWNYAGMLYRNLLKQPDLKDKLKIGTYEEGQVMLGNQVVVLAGAAHPNAGKLFVEYLLSKEGTDIYVAGDALYSFRANYEPPAEVAPLMFDLNEVKLVGLDDWVDAQRDFKEVHSLWQTYFR